MDPLSILLSLLTNKYVIGIVAIGGGIATIFFKGRSSGEASVKQADAATAQKINDDVQKTEATNLQLDAQRDKNAQIINNTADIDELARMLSSLTDGNKTKDTPSK